MLNRMLERHNEPQNQSEKIIKKYSGLCFPPALRDLKHRRKPMIFLFYHYIMKYAVRRESACLERPGPSFPFFSVFRSSVSNIRARTST